MLMLWSVLAVLAVGQVVRVDGQKLFATFRSTLIRDRTFAVNLALETAGKGPLTYNVALENGVGDSLYANSNQDVTISQGAQTAEAVFTVPAETSLSNSMVVVRLNSLTVLSSNIDMVRDPSSSTIAQTDKGTYKPGDTVNFRILNLDSEGKPLNEEFEVVVTDPEETKIWKKVSNPIDKARGIIDGNFTLIDDAFLGTYKITVLGSAKKEITFTVEEYVLPKFETMLTLDVKSYASEDLTQFPLLGNVKAVYTHGRFVRGTLKVKVNGEDVLTEPNFDGSDRFQVELLTNKYLTGGASSSALKVQAVVMESLTDITANASDTFMLYSAPFMVQPVEPVPFYSSEDSTYNISVMMMDVSGSAFQLPTDGTPPYTLYYQYLINGDTVIRSVVVTENPVPVTIDLERGVSITNDNLKIWASRKMTGKEELRSAVVPVKVRSMSSNSMKYISIVDVQLGKDLNQKDKACFKITPFLDRDQAFYQVVGNSGAHRILKYTQTTGHCFLLTADMSPKFEIVGYKIQDYTEGDTTEVLQEVLVNKHVGMYAVPSMEMVKMSVNPTVVKPGASVTINVTSMSQGTSYLGMRAIDKSTVLLSPPHDVSLMKLSELKAMDRMFDSGPSKDYGSSDDIMPFGRMSMFYSPTVTPGTLLSEAGFNIAVSKGLYFHDNQIYNGFLQKGDNNADAMVDMAGAMPDAEANVDADKSVATDSSEAKAAEEDQTRKDFPETWLWSLTEISSGITLMTETVPDTITNWVIDAFTLNSNDGLSVVPTQELTVTQELFISMNLPYSLVRGERVTLQILVFNYKNEGVRVNVTLESSDDFEIMDPSKRTATFEVGPGASGVLEVPIKAKTIGDIILKASAVDEADSTVRDVIEQPLLVEAEGHEIRNSTQLKFEFPESGGTKSFDIMDLVQIGDNLVDGSLRAYVLITGDSMGPYISGLDNFVRMPHGCGEQNMITMVPGLFVGKYLKSRNKLDTNTKDRVEKACNSGYQREMKYMHSGKENPINKGAFSAFGGSGGANGSTWLTAYVLNVFAKIGEEDFADNFDARDLYDAFTFLKSKKIAGGDEFFKEDGVVIHQDMLGGVTGEKNELAFSAFILICIQDYFDYLDSADDTTRKPDVRMLIEDTSAVLFNADVTRTPYTNVMFAYALARSGMILNDTDYKMFADEAMKRFDSDAARKKRDIRYPKPTSTVIETHGYALLAYVTLSKAYPSRLNEFKELSRELTNWLIKNRNSDGFFTTTQDTSVALQALAEYAIAFPDENSVNFGIKVNAGGQTAQFNNDNYYVQVQEPVALDFPTNSVLNMELTGSSGQAFVSVLAIFNSNAGTEVSPLEVTVKPHQSFDNKPYLKVAVKAGDGTDGEISSMVLVQMKMQSGMTVINVVGENTVSNPERIEYSKDKRVVTCYYLKKDDEPFTQTRTTNVFYDKKYQVDGLQPGQVKVTDYYHAENTNVEMVDVLSETVIVDVTDKPTTGASSATISILLLALTCVMIFLNRHVY